MKPSHRRILTHLVCIGIGLGLAASLREAMSALNETHAANEARPSSPATDAPLPERPGRPFQVKEKASPENGSAARPGGDFKGAWEAIASRKLTISERLEMQIGVLKQWSMVDMEGAMRAALDNAWDGGTAKGGVDPLMVAFEEAFKARPLVAWDLLQSGKLGLGTELFRQQWIKSAAQTEPVFLFSVAAEIPVGLRMAAIQEAMRSAAKSPELKEEMIRKLADLPDTPSANNYIAIAFNALPANEGNAAEIRGALAAATNDRAKTILLHEYTSTLREANASVLSAEWGKLTPEMQRRAAIAFYNGAQGTKNAPVVLDMLIRTEQWDTAQSASSRLIEYGRSTDKPGELAAWGMSLPQRPETQDLFRRSIDPYINRNNAEAREWIQTLPLGDWRTERVLYAFTQNALYARNNEELYQWALDRIVDPETKGAAARSYDGWARRRGLEPK